MHKRRLDIIARVLTVVLVVSALTYVLLYLFIAAKRISYPYELEWMEGGAVDHVRRILSGEPLYVEPSLEFIPYSYTPLYFYISAAFSKFLGVGFFPLRLVSFLSSIGCFAALFLFVRRETKAVVPALVSMGLYAATYRISGAWFDIARVDSLFLLFLLFGALLLRVRPTVRVHVLAGVLLALSYLTKQSTLLPALSLCAASLITTHGRLRLVCSATFVGIAASSTLIGNYLTDGWYTYHLFQLPSQLVIIKGKILTFWTADLAGQLPIAIGLSCLPFMRLASKRRWEDLLFLSFFLAGMIGTSWVSRVPIGGYDNVLCPTYAIIAICAGLGLHQLLGTTSARSAGVAGNTSTTSEVRSRALACIGALLLLIQFGSLIYDVRAQIPKQADVLAGDEFVRLLRTIEGDVFVPGHGFLPALAGKKTHAHTWLMMDVLRSDDSEVRDKLRADLNQALLEKRFGAVILDRPWDVLDQGLRKNYVKTKRIFDNDAVFWTLTGLRTRPQSLFEPKR